MLNNDQREYIYNSVSKKNYLYKPLSLILTTHQKFRHKIVYLVLFNTQRDLDAIYEFKRR